MRVYIAYKYRAVEDKNELKRDLDMISGAIDGLNHEHFILGRDVQKWHASSGSVLKTIPHIIKNILGSDMVFAYINCSVSSWGLPFEMFCAKIFKKPVILAVKQGITYTNPALKPADTIVFTDIQDLVSKIAVLKID
jgi:hypothetical protein